MFITRKRVILISLAAAALCAVVSTACLSGPSSNRLLYGVPGVVTSPPPVGGYVGEAGSPVVGDMRKAVTALEGKVGFSNFIAEAGPGWSVQWNTMTGTPHLASGKAMSIAGADHLTKENIEPACLGFVRDNAQLLKVEPVALRLVSAVKAGSCWYVAFQQMYDGVPVFGGQLTMSFTKDDRLIMFGSDVYPGLIADTIPKIDQKAAIETALTDCGGATRDSQVSKAELSIFPVRSAGGSDYVLCWQFTILQQKAAKKWQYFVDAGTGKIVAKWDALIYLNTTGTVTGDYKPEFAADTIQTAPFRHEKVLASGPETVIQSWNMDSNPGWTMEGQWAYGTPTGGGGSHGYPDPTSGHTGSSVCGVNLSGDYSLTVGGPWYLTTGAINCTGHNNVLLKFWRWLNSDYQNYAYATVQVSSNGSLWTTVWQNGSTGINDSAWAQCSYDISAVAANQPTVFVRWGYQIGSGAWAYSGWNIDDVQVVSVLGSPGTVFTQTDGTYSVAPPYDPSRITSTLEGQYCDIVHEDGPDPLFERTDVHSGDVVDWAWDATLYGAAAHVHAPSVYYHINYIHDYYKVLDPSFTGLDYAVPTNVGRSGYNNAYWDGTGMTFGGGDGVNYLDFGLFSEVVYHEYTHGVTDKIYTGISFPYAMEPGAMNEGWSDYFGCELSLSELSKVGDGGLIPSQPNGFRNLTNTDRRETDWVNEVHYDSEMFSAGLWEARASLGSTLMEELVHFARYRHATDFEGYLTAILLEDDVRYGDSDLTNGAPHGQAIYTGFGNHGIGGLQYQWQSLVVNDSSGNGNAKLDPGETVSLSLTLANGWANATNVQATLASADPYVTISKATANFGSVLRGGTANNSADTFTISVLPTCPETHTVNFTLTLTAQGPYSYTRTCLIYASVAVGQLAYDDGAADSGLGYGLSGAGLAVRMTPDAYPCYITHVRLWPRSSATTTLKVWDDNGTNGSPSTVLGSKSVTLSSADTWVDVDISSLNINVTSGSVYVGWVDGSAMYANGLDCDPSYYIRSWAYSGTSWSQIESAGFLGNMMVRARFSGVSPLQIIPPYAYDWIVGLPASGSLATSNGTAPFSWSVAAGALPPGVGLDSATGSFTGSPTAGGTYTATIQVTDSSSTVRQGVHEFTFSVGGPPPVPFNPHPADGATDVPVNTMLSWECQATGGEIIDDFEDGSLSEYTILGGTHDVIGAAAHDGNFGLSSSSSAWIYRADPGAVLSQGDTVSYWVLLGSSAGRAYCGFGASANGTYSAVAAPNTSTFKIQINQSYNYADLASASQSWVDNHWYRIEVQWDTGGLITARLFDSDGASLLNTISATNNTYTSGGIAFRGFGAPNYFDTVTRGAGGPVSGTTYDVYMGPSCDNLSLIASNLNQPTYDPPVDLQAGTTYHWKVVAKNSYGNTEGPCWSFTTGSILPPAPTNPSPPDGSLNNHLDVDLSWGGGGTAELIVNGDFETGDFTGWTQANTGLGSFSINNGTFDPAGPDGPLPPFAGNYSALSVPTGPGVLSIYQDISIPLGASSALLTWVDRIRNHHTAFVDPNQEYRVEIRNTQNVLLAQAFSTNPGNPLFSDWTARSFDLSAFAGSTVRVAFVTQVQYYFMNAHLDNVSVQINTGAPAGLTYDVYFGTNPIPGPGEFKGNTPTTSWELPVLESDTLYYWKVVAKNAGAEASGPVWSFRTGAVAPVPSDPIPPDDAIDVPVSTSLSWNGGGSLGVQNSGASLLINGGFETGDFTGWTVVTGPGNQFQPWTLATAGSGNWFHNGIPSEGLRFAQNGFDGAAGLYYDIYQEVAIPSAATSALLVWSERLQWNTTYGATVARPYTVTLQPAGGGAPLATLFSTTLPPGTTGDTGYVAHSINLLSVAPGAAGQTVRINFHESIPESNKGPAQFDLDGVSLTVVEGGSTTYDVYMGPSCDNLSLIASNLNQPTYDPPGNLQAAMTYHWKVVAKNAFGNTEGPCWSFTTGLATTPVANLAALKAKAGTGETVQLTGNVTVTCKNSGLFFVGEQSYKGCIKVIGADVVATGEHVTNLIGIVTVDSYGQYTITLSAPVSPAATGNAIKTVGVNNKSAKTDAKLLTNLVRVWGLVSGATITDGYIAPITVINPALGAGVIVVSGVLWREGGDVVLYQNLP